MQVSRISLWLMATALGALAAGCASSPPPLPVVRYPVTYQVPVGGGTLPEPDVKTRLPQPDISATQDVVVSAGQPLYFRILSPVSVRVYLYEKVGASPNGNLLGHVDVPAGRTVKQRIVPPTSDLEFLFAQQEGTRPATLRFTLSAQPLTGGNDRSPPETFIGD